MPYEYQSERPNIFTEEGQRLFLKVRDKTQSLLRQAGAARSQEMLAGCCGDGWTMLACIDRLVELGEIREVTDGRVAGQHRVFVAT